MENNNNQKSTISNEEISELEKLRLSQNYSGGVETKKVSSTVPIRKPDRHSFSRVHPDEKWRLETKVLELKEERELYLVSPDLWEDLDGELIPKILLTTISRQGALFLWPIRLPSEDGQHDEWNRSALEAAELATKNWIRLIPNRSLGAYETYQAMASLPEPNWPEEEFREILKRAFKDRWIKTQDHPVLKRLRGES